MDIKLILGFQKYDIKEIKWLDSTYNDVPYYLSISAPYLEMEDGKIISYKELKREKLIKLYESGEGYISIAQHIFRLINIPYFDLYKMLKIHDLLNTKDIKLLIWHTNNAINNSTTEQEKTENTKKGKDLKERLNELLPLIETKSNQPQQVTKADTPQKKDFKQHGWFKVAVLFASGKMQKYYTKNSNNKFVIKPEYTAPKIADNLNIPDYHKEILATLKDYKKDNSNGNKNIFNRTSTELKEVIKYCENKKYDLTPDFIERYNLIKDK